MHIPVLLNEVIKYLEPKPNENFLDATFGEGGHAAKILEKTQPKGKLLGIERDPVLYKNVILGLTQFRIANPQFSERLILINDSYVHLETIVKAKQFQPLQGILFDLGMCSWQIDDSSRGFSYLKDEPLDMRFNPQESLTAAEIVNFWPEEEIEQILKIYGEERYSRRIAQIIKEERRKHRIVGTQELLKIIEKAVPKNYEHHRLSPGTRTFQALRIAVNNELENIKLGLEQALRVLQPQGRIVVISFHSLEDRIVKNFFREQSQAKKITILTKKPITPSSKELRNNSRSHSAKLRAALKINS
ncbi:MAG: 16S rRNA (cytosine(1402)-N(4))-methyltransferase RsmH [Minisyncoccia bacterium]